MSVLQDERIALLSGRLDALPDLAQRKLDLLPSLLSATHDAATIARIDQALRRNARLLAAARDGIAAARDRLTAVKAVRDGLDVYGADGSRTSILRRNDMLERKA
ncbi:hypothetical protein [Loktanella fryxellensis]|uniref:hypothetical protein n=1 Tax=Loktanella fryxellensis TaxID=245187 RepID=UPI000B7C6047|nr:hypothetical protein [Loktanella fryxellensis]